MATQTNRRRRLEETDREVAQAGRQMATENQENLVELGRVTIHQRGKRLDLSVIS